MITKYEKKDFFAKTLEEIYTKYNIKVKVTLKQALQWVPYVVIYRLCEKERNTINYNIKANVNDLVGCTRGNFFPYSRITLIKDIPNKFKYYSCKLDKGLDWKALYGGQDLYILEYIHLKHLNEMAKLYLKAEGKGQEPKVIFDPNNGMIKEVPKVWTDLHFDEFSF